MSVVYRFELRQEFNTVSIVLDRGSVEVALALGQQPFFKNEKLPTLHLNVLGREGDSYTVTTAIRVDNQPGGSSFIRDSITLNAEEIHEPPATVLQLLQEHFTFELAGLTIY